MSKILCKIKHGSHLYGLNTEKSDTDYKGVFLPELEQLILTTAPEHISSSTGQTDQRNTKEDIDFEAFSLQRFLKLVETGQPMALEMLFAPDSMIIEDSAEWRLIRSKRKELLTKESKAFVGYCKSQASKYCLKGARLAALKRCKDQLIGLNSTEHVSWFDGFYTLNYSDKSDYLKFLNTEEKHGRAFELLGKKFYETANLTTVISSLDSLEGRYGQRTREMAGKDWKALSHAVRIAIEVTELLATGHITLPLKEADRSYVLKIKEGMVPLEEVEETLVVLLDNLKVVGETSQLPTKFNHELAKELILNMYKERETIYA